MLKSLPFEGKVGRVSDSDEVWHGFTVAYIDSFRIAHTSSVSFADSFPS